MTDDVWSIEDTVGDVPLGSPEQRLREAAKQIRLARDEIAHAGEIQTLLRIETDVRGAIGMLEAWRAERDSEGGETDA